MAAGDRVDLLNQQLRGNQAYRAFLRSMGVNPDAPIKLTDRQRETAARWYAANIGPLDGLEIDPAGNLNSDKGFDAISFGGGGGGVGGGGARGGGSSGYQPGPGYGDDGRIGPPATDPFDEHYRLPPRTLPPVITPPPEDPYTPPEDDPPPADDDDGDGKSGLDEILDWLGQAGADLSFDDILKLIGTVTGGLGSGAADARAAANDWRGARDIALTSIARDKANSDWRIADSTFDRGLQGAEFNRTGQTREQKQAMASGLLQGVQDFSVTPGNPAIAAKMGTTTGGLRPSALAGSKDSILEVLGRPQIQAPTYTAPSPYEKPELPDYEEADDLEKWLSTAGLVLKTWGNRRGTPRTP